MSNENGSGIFGTLLIGLGLASLAVLFGKAVKRLGRAAGPALTLLFCSVVFAAAAIGWPYLDTWSQETPLGVMEPLKVVFRLVPGWSLWLLATGSLVLLILHLFVAVPAKPQE